MPTIISHAAVPLALGIGLGGRRIPGPLLATGVLASMLPDVDVILFRFGATYDGPWAHRGFSHSLMFAMLVGLLAAFCLRRTAAPLLAFTFVAVSAASHGLLDMLTNGGHGIALLWPFDGHRYFFAWRPIQVSPLAPVRFATKAAAVARSEACWIWLPALAIAAALRVQRRSGGAAS